MRVAFDVGIHAAAPPMGTERAQATLLAALAERGDHELLLFSPHTVPASLAAGAAVVAGASGLPLAVWRERVLPGLLTRHGADVLHSPVAALPLRAGCPTVATIHDLPWVRYRSRPGGGFDDAAGWQLAHRARTWIAARRAARLMCVSERTAADLLRCHPDCEDRIRVVPHGVDPRFGPETRRDRAATLACLDLQDGVYLLAVGARRRRKNLRTLVAALSSRPDLTLIVVGPPGDDDGLPRSGSDSRVTLAGWLDDDLLADLYRHAAVVVHPATQEGFGLPVLEAMACGTPVLCCEQGAVPEARGDAAVVVDAAGGPAALLAGLLPLLSGPDREQAIRRGLALAARRSAAAMAAGASRLYEELL